MKSNLSTDETTESESGELACVDAILIQVTNVNLNRGVVLGGDESVCGRAEIRCHKQIQKRVGHKNENSVK